MQLELVRHDKCLHLTPAAERIFRHNFYICNRELGIVNRPGVVRVDFHPLEKGIGGHTDAEKTDPYVVSINVRSLHEIIHTQSHEMVHVDQMRRGDLRLVKDFRDEPQVLWKGNPIFIDVDARMRGEINDAERDEPHEREAYSIGPKLYRKTIDSLPREDLQFLLENADGCGANPEDTFANWKAIKRLADEKRTQRRLNGNGQFPPGFPPELAELMGKLGVDLSSIR